ncbi:MAG: serine/threonine-protein kinase [Thermoguttaceae bacterium]
MIDSVPERDPVEELADEFVERLRRGETPSIAQYSERYPQYAEQIEELFPTVAALEQYRGQEESHRRSGLCVGGGRVPEVLGDFRIVGEIGRGGMGVVYEAEQQSLARRVALKVLPRHALLQERDRRRFEREAQTAAGLHHTHIVPVFGAGVHGDLHYYVMPLVSGVGLDEVIRRLRAAGAPAGREHAARVARIGIQAAEALDYAHGQGTLHRDVKPGNLLVDGSDHVSVADFGLARAIDPGDAAGGEVVGTPRYMAPEQFRGRADARSDLYALGATLYELATLEAAFEDSGPRPGLPVPPRQINPAIPRDLETIVLKCLEPDPDRRYVNAAALAEDLGRFVEGRPIRARHVGWPERLVRWCRRNPALASVSALAAMLLAVAAVTALAAHLRTRNAYEQTAAALRRAEASSLVALEALDEIYLQLSPDRIWIRSGVDTRGESCVCLGLRSEGGPLPAQGRTAMQVRASAETAALLKGLLVCYDRLAEQAGDNRLVQLQSAIACRRIGDIRQLLGQLAEAERDYGRAVERLEGLRDAVRRDPQVAVELARTHNGLGNVRSARLDSGAAYASHRAALAALQQAGVLGQLPAECRYETARTLYFLATKATFELGDRRGDDRADPPGGSLRPYNSQQCRRAAAAILEELVREYPALPDYRFLLALSLRPAVSAAMNRAEAAERRRAISILEELVEAHPDVLDYRYELAATCAWIHVGLFPWQQPVAEPDARPGLERALVELRWLTEHNPSIPRYACSHALLLAKLADTCDRQGEHARAATLFGQALAAQEDAIERFSELPPHHQVLREFMRLKLAQTLLHGDATAADPESLRRSRALLETCIVELEELAERSPLADDRLASAAIPVAYDMLGKIRAGPDDEVPSSQ